MNENTNGLEEILKLNVLLDIQSIDSKKLIGMLDILKEEEAKISYQRRILHGKIDQIRSELLKRRKESSGGEVILNEDEVSKLADILAGKGILEHDGGETPYVEE